MMKIYVGTYAKYNNGSIEGRWLNLDDYADADEFISCCKELHRDEEDPELMFQDWEGIPDRLAGECMDMHAVYAYREMLEKVSNAEAFEIWVDDGNDPDVDAFDDAFRGEWDSEKDFAYDLAEESGYLSAMERAGVNPYYFDHDAFARDIFMGDYWFKDGFVFVR